MNIASPDTNEVMFDRNTFRLRSTARAIIGSRVRISMTMDAMINTNGRANRLLMNPEVQPCDVRSVSAMRNEMIAIANVMAPGKSTRGGGRMGDSFSVSAATTTSTRATGITE